MAEGQEDRSTEDLSDEISSYRLEEYRRKGQVSQSKELSALAALLAAAVATYVMSPTMGSQLAEFMREVFRTDLSARVDLGSPGVARGYLEKAIKIVGALSLPIAFAAFVAGIGSSFAQIGSIFSTDPITPNFQKIDPIAGFKRIFSLKTLVEGIRLTLKLAVAGLIAYFLVRSEVFQAPLYVAGEPEGMFLGFSHSSKRIFLSLFGVLLVFAIVDFALQRWEYNKQLRLTKQEAKEEHKEREGDPMIKARMRAVQRDMARKRMMAAVKKADVIVTNPTHIAIALVYDRKAHAAPKVVAKGADFVAQRIRKIATDAGIPIVENVPLARTLYKTVKVNQFIPRALYQAVAEVLAYVYRLKGRGF